jgi:hypothetical protein
MAKPLGDRLSLDNHRSSAGWKIIGHGDRRIRNLVSRNTAGFHSSRQVLQATNGCFPPRDHKPNNDPICGPIAWLWRCYKRRSKISRHYRTPVNVFREPNGFLIALTYGRDSGWVTNVLIAGGCQLETRRAKYQLSEPVIVHDPSRGRFPPIVRLVLGLIDANDFLQLSELKYSNQDMSEGPISS